MRTTHFTTITIVMLLLGTACTRPATLVERERPDRFSADADQWEFLIAADARIGSEPPAFPPAILSDNWRPLHELRDRDFPAFAGIWVRTKLLSNMPDDPHLLISGTAGTFAIYIDTALFFRYGDFHVDHPVQEPHSLFHIIPIPPRPDRQYLYIWRPHPISNALDYTEAVVTSGSDIPLFISESMRLGQVREDYSDLLFGLLFLAVGLAMVLVAPLLWKSQGRSLLLLGLAGMMYGIRLLAELTTLHILVVWPEPVWRYLVAIITYVIPIPMLLWFLGVVGSAWKSSVRVFLYVQCTFSVAAISLAVITDTPEYAMAANSYVMLVLMLVIMAILRQAYMHRRRSLYLIGGFLILSIINENLVGADLVSWDFEFETLGFFVGFCGLGFFAVRRYFLNQRDLQAIEVELKTARDIQESILPSGNPSIPGLDIAVSYVPMAEVAGDFYDFIQVDDSRLGIMIADVSGHGVPAALIASMVKVTFESQTPVASDPAQVLKGMNQTFCGNLEGQFVTVGYLFVDLSKPEVTYAGAGHPPVLIQSRETGRIGEFGENGLLLAGFEHAEYVNTHIEPRSGDRFILYTDGIIEASNDRNEQFGLDRLKEFFTDRKHLNAVEFTEALIDHLSEWTGKRSMEDDLTLIVIDYTAT